jgi:hypothetical protein
MKKCFISKKIVVSAIFLVPKNRSVLGWYLLIAHGKSRAFLIISFEFLSSPSSSANIKSADLRAFW